MSKQIFHTEDRQLKWIPCNKLSVLWAQAQRPLRESWAMEIGNELDPDALGIIAVTMPNGTGIYHVVDGQHRVVGVRDVHGEDQCVPCMVLDAKDPKRAAEIWLKLNKNKKAHPVEHFFLRVTAEEAAACDIYRIVQSKGLEISNRMHRDEADQVFISAVDALAWIYTRHGAEVLGVTLTLIGGIWGQDPYSYSTATLKAVGKFCGEHRGHFDAARFVEKARRKWKGWSNFQNDAKKRGLNDNVAAYEGGYRLFVMAYNYGLSRDDKLPM